MYNVQLGEQALGARGATAPPNADGIEVPPWAASILAHEPSPPARRLSPVLAMVCGLLALLCRALLRIPPILRWHRRRRETRKWQDAAAARERALAELPADRAHELMSLEKLVAHVRGRQPSRACGRDSALVERLHHLLYEFARRARALERVVPALALTEGVGEAQPDTALCHRFAHGLPSAELSRRREQVRKRCCELIRVIDADLARISITIRLVYEQQLASFLWDQSIAVPIDEVIEEAELTLSARAEADATVPQSAA